MTAETRAAIALCGRVLGALFYLPPADPAVVPLLHLAESGELVAEWPFARAEVAAEVAPLLAQVDWGDAHALATEYQRLFIGPDALAAPPWGSVWLSEEGTLCGPSTLALRDFHARHGIVLATRQREPEDHFGLLMWAAAWLAERDADAALGVLLREHLAPWAGRYLETFRQAAVHPFYQGAGRLAELSVQAMLEALSGD